MQPIDERRLDYQLMRDTPVRVFADRTLLTEVREWLAGHGYRIIAVDVADSSPEGIYHQMAEQAPEWPPRYVNDPDGFDDALRDLEGDYIAFIFYGYQGFVRRHPSEAVAVLDALAREAWWYLLYGRRLITLVENPDVELPRLGSKTALRYYGHPTFEE